MVIMTCIIPLGLTEAQHERIKLERRVLEMQMREEIAAMAELLLSATIQGETVQSQFLVFADESRVPLPSSFPRQKIFIQSLARP